MNVVAPAAFAEIRTAMLADPRECRRIDDYLAEHPEAELFHRPQWSRGVEKGCGQRSHYLVAEDAARRLVGCLPLTEIRSRLFGSALVSAGFATGGGILADDAAVAERLARQGWELAQKLGCATMELRGGPLPEDWTPKEGVYSSFARHLPASEEALLRSIPRRQRAEVRKALGFSLDVTSGRDAAHREAFHRAYAESVRNLGTPVFPRSLFEAMLDEFGEDADITLVRKDGEPLATLLNFYFKGTMYAYWGGGTGKARDRRGNDLVWFAAMRGAIARGCTRADFGRSKVGTGPYNRKKIWDFDERPLVYGVRTAEGMAPREINPLSPKYRLQVQLWSKLPLWLANRLGPPIARGLG